jgi:hypothetical protein
MKTYGGVKVYFHSLLTSALDGGEWSVSDPRLLTPGVHLIGGLVGYRAVLGTLEEIEISFPFWKYNHNSLVVRVVAIIMELNY